MVSQNRITEVLVKLDKQDGHYRVFITKEFEEQYGGGESTICLPGTFTLLHPAVDYAKQAVTLQPANKEDFESRGEQCCNCDAHPIDKHTYDAELHRPTCPMSPLYD